MNSELSRCFKSRATRSHLLSPLLQNTELLAEFSEVAQEYAQREINKTSFVLRGDFNGLKDLHAAVVGVVNHVVDDEAADSIVAVRYLGAGSLVHVKCSDMYQCQRITQHRLAFSSIDHTPHQSATVQRVLRTKLYVDAYCTKEQLAIRHTQWQLFHELKREGLKPSFRGEQLYYRPAGTKRAIAHTVTQPATEHQQVAPIEQRCVAQAVVKGTQQQHEQARAEQRVAQPAEEQLYVEQHVLHQAQAVAEQPQPSTSVTAPAVTSPATTSPDGSAEREALATPPVDALAASASAVTATTALASKQAGKQQQREPRQKQSKSSSAMNPATQHTTRPPLRSISNTTPKLPSKGPTNNKGRPVWGARNAPYGSYLSVVKADRTPHMLPSGQVVFY